uniref:Uncharacterized protein n=1 Tax=Romanomermis culicivorax TaxID=13658 RepID=A0A915J368_ROMCU
MRILENKPKIRKYYNSNSCKGGFSFFIVFLFCEEQSMIASSSLTSFSLRAINTNRCRQRSSPLCALPFPQTDAKCCAIEKRFWENNREKSPFVKVSKNDDTGLNIYP